MRRALRFLPPLLVFAAGLAAGAWFGIERRAAGFAAGVERRLAEAAARPYRERSRVAGQWDWRGLDSAVSLAWAQAMPDTALAQAMAAPGAPWAEAISWAAMNTLAGGDPARRLEALAGLPANRL